MKVVIQRVSSASVTVDNVIVGQISAGLAVLVGFGKDDDEKKLPIMAEKIVNMRIFSNEAGRYDYSLLNTKEELLLIPQFTLYADTTHGRRPDFFSALEPQKAAPLFDKFIYYCQKQGIKVENGIFGAMMQVKIVNEGPTTIIVDL